MTRLDGKVALITGAGRGIGRAIALKLAREGARVVVNDLDDEPATETIAAIGAEGGAAVSCNGSVVEAGFAERFVQTALDRFGGLDIIVNNAGFTRDNVIQKMTDEQFQAVLDVHVTAPFRILRAAAEPIRRFAKQEAEQGREVFRKVVNISSVSGLVRQRRADKLRRGEGGRRGDDEDVGEGMGSVSRQRELRGVRLHHRRA